jgi:hypothetical protein
MAVLGLWLVLKSVGIIKTPFWLEYGVPIGTFALGLITFYQSLIDKVLRLSVNDARMDSRLEHLEHDVDIMKTDVGTLKTDVRLLKTDVEILKAHV